MPQITSTMTPDITTPNNISAKVFNILIIIYN